MSRVPELTPLDDTIQLHPQTLARLLTQAESSGLGPYMDQKGFPSIRLIGNPHLKPDQMLIPSRWLSEESKQNHAQSHSHQHPDHP